MAAMTIFERLNRGQPAPVKKKTEQQPQEQAKVLLDWLLRWPKPVLTLNDIRNFSPRAIRDKETAIRSAQILAAHGHLAPLADHKWQIVRQTLIPADSR
jgi:hypothetical protein